MKQDKFLLGIIAGIVLLVTIALLVFFTRQSVEYQYQPEDSPKAVVFNYILALQKGDNQKAYDYLGELSFKPSRPDFDKYIAMNKTMAEDMAFEISSEIITNQTAIVNVKIVNYNGGIFTSSYGMQEIAELVLVDGRWKILQMPYVYWSYDWNQPMVK